jgi:hypothetical protein
MYQGQLIGGSEPKKFEVEKPFSGYGLKIAVGGELGEDLYKAENQEQFLEVVRALYPEVTINVTYSYKDGNPIRPISQMALFSIIEHAQNEEGIIKVTYSNEEIVDNKSVTFEVYLPLTKDGNILFNNDEIMTLELSASADITIDVWTIESAIAAPDFFNFQNLDILQGKKDVEFDVSKYESIMIPTASVTANTEITIEFTNGKICRYRKPELQFIGLLVNDLCFSSYDRSINGFGNYAIMNTSTVKSIRINRDTVSAFTILAVERVVVKDVQNVARANSGMVDLTTVKLERDIQAKFN